LKKIFDLKLIDCSIVAALCELTVLWNESDYWNSKCDNKGSLVFLRTL